MNTKSMILPLRWTQKISHGSSAITLEIFLRNTNGTLIHLRDKEANDSKIEQVFPSQSRVYSKAVYYTAKYRFFTSSSFASSVMLP